MIVLGMAGHVDHGKTALVKALTGINTDRLPEEKSRGMTTDLGFASMRLTAGGADAGFARRGVSISDCVEFGLIDVPGHERYIRNMVAGAWALDLALLVVAANDGWMEQTENHARVLAALGPPRVMPVITKIDLIEPSHLVSIIDDVLARASLILGASCLAPAQSVSTVASRGLKALKSALYEEGAEILKKKKRDSESRNPRDAPFLYVDRVFSRAGAGTIVCGTLVGNGFSSGDAVLILPSGIEARIKSMESLGKRVERAEGAVRLALNLSKGKAVPIRGDLVVLPGQKASFDVAAEFIIGVEDLAASTPSPDRKSPVLEKGGELEAAVGSASRIGRIAPLGKKGFYRLLLDEPLALPRRLPLALIRHGGAQVLGRAWVVSSGRTDQALRRKIGSVLRESGIAPGPDAREKLIRALEARTKPVPGSTLRARAEPAAGAPRLSPAAMKAEALLRKLWNSGLEMGASRLRTVPDCSSRTAAQAIPRREQIDELCAAGIAIPLDRDLFIHREAYEELVKATLDGLKAGESLDMAETKARTGFSRKYAIPFLNRMERDGWVKRDGDRRIVLKSEARSDSPSSKPALPRSPSSGLPNT